MSGFSRLHPALQHHIVNSLEWKRLRPLQEEAIKPLLAGEHTLLLAPTAGGKTEAAFFPLLSRMLSEDWRGTSLLYIAPLRALLNNLEPRLRRYCSLVGRDAGVWHGDVNDSGRQRIINQPPDCLLITPESLEVILVSRRWNKERLFGGVRAVIVDEIHAFAGDDRGWHLLAVLERVARLAGREIQRVGLSATVGNPPALLEWLAGSSVGPRRAIAPEGQSRQDAQVTLDHVGSLDNAATVISRLYRGEKRLVFCDSRSEVESLARLLRHLGVDTHLSHSSLSRDARVRAEDAFSQGTDCVIVATSTLELGIDVGDLDRVVQIGAPHSVSSFLQRLGRTGRRLGSAGNCLFLTTSEENFLRACGVVHLWRQGFVEPVHPPAMPLHLLAQQIMALALQQGGIGLESWRDWIGQMPGFAALAREDVEQAVGYMLRAGILAADNGVLWFGKEGEARFGRRNFMALLSSFISEPLFAVRYGRQHLGLVDRTSFALHHDRPPVLLLAGHSWIVNHVDWKNATVFVEPSDEEGKSHWLGAGQPLSYALCQSIKAVLAGEIPRCELSKRALAQLEQAREAFAWIEADRTSLVSDCAGTRWWTFGGLLANSTIAALLHRFRVRTGNPDNFAIRIDDPSAVANWDSVMAALRGVPAEEIVAPVDPKALEQLKFSECLPVDLATKELAARLTDRESVSTLLRQSATVCTLP